ncbi:MAG: hypothetical protein JSU72_15425 [Deltaproteobacteria bacterium]|nr:MAG: hypothetical protein JSU72_15425 [Deltaproteobacteria bacterium]
MDQNDGDLSAGDWWTDGFSLTDVSLMTLNTPALKDEIVQIEGERTIRDRRVDKH